jgi:aldose 1-epimerase
VTRIRAEDWGRTVHGERVTLFTLERDGLRARLSDFGACLVSLEFADEAGGSTDVVLGFDRHEDYESPGNPYFGGLVGRVANRIAGARFELDGRTYELSANEGRHHLHGGARGFDRRPWEAAVDEARSRVTFVRRSPDGEEGYPGNVDVRASYSLGPDRSLELECEATTDAPTLVNFTQHSYFNLAGAGTVAQHSLELRAARRVEVDAELIPTGALRDVAGSEFDFRAPRALGGPADGYDLCFALDGDRASVPLLACRLADPDSGRALELSTTQPGLQLYTGGRLHGLRGKGGRAIPRLGGVCLEPQHFPDSVHHPRFPATVLRPGERYRHSTRWQFLDTR